MSKHGLHPSPGERLSRKHAGSEASHAPSEDRSWAARAEALKRERPAQLAIILAVFAVLVALAGWVAVLVPPGGNIRFSPVFWLLAAPLLPWLWGVQATAPWAVKTLWFALVLAPCLSLLALFVAPMRRQAALLENGAAYLDTSFAMLVIVFLTTALAVAGLICLRRSSLPGGTRPVTYAVPGQLIPGAPHLSPAAAGALRMGSVPFSGALVNGMFFGIIAELEPVGPSGRVWPLALVVILVLCVGTLVFRGGFRLARRRTGAARDLRRGWQLGISCAIAAIPAVGAWPVPEAAKLGLGCFMVPIALAATWFGIKALRELPEILADAGHG